MHFAIEGLLDGGISDQHEVAKFEVILDYGGGMLLFKTDHGFDSCGVYVRTDSSSNFPITSLMTHTP